MYFKLLLILVALSAAVGSPYEDEPLLWIMNFLYKACLKSKSKIDCKEFSDIIYYDNNNNLNRGVAIFLDEALRSMMANPFFQVDSSYGDYLELAEYVRIRRTGLPAFQVGIDLSIWPLLMEMKNY